MLYHGVLTAFVRPTNYLKVYRRNTYTRYSIRRLMVFRLVPFNLKKKGGLGWRPEGHLSFSRCYTRNEMTRRRFYIYIYIYIQSYCSL